MLSGPQDDDNFMDSISFTIPAGSMRIGSIGIKSACGKLRHSFVEHAGEKKFEKTLFSTDGHSERGMG